MDDEAKTQEQLLAEVERLRRRIALVEASEAEQKQADEVPKKERRLLKESLDVREREQKLLAHEIHDGLVQQLTGAVLRLETFESLQKEDAEEARRNFEIALGLLRAGIAEARRVIAGLCPPVLDALGVVAALEYLVGEMNRREKIKIKLVCEVTFDRLAAALETAIFRIVQEALTNACRHSQSEKVRVELVERQGRVCVDIQDWGIGFGQNKVAEDRFGLVGIQERARLLGGRATIETAPGKGTHIRAELPRLDAA